VKHEQQTANIERPLTDEEIRITAENLKRLPKGFLPKEIFLAVAELVTTPTMEVAPLRINENRQTEVLLTQRPADDAHWPNGWHMPGTVIRSTDEEGSLRSGFNRILQSELKEDVRPLAEPVFVGTKFWDVERGRELDQMYYIEVEANDETPGQFFTVDNLPETTLAHHKVMIPEIIMAFEFNKQRASDLLVTSAH
jgi:hypothetical protein